MPFTSRQPTENMARVSRAPIVACLTCPLCGNLFREATTISECLHTFCKECIHERFNDEEINSCPMCNVDLGTVPLEKLRADPQLDDVQAKIFHFDPEKRPVNAAPIWTQTTPVRRKERLLSSLGVVSVPSSSRSRKRKKKAWVTESSDSYEEDEGRSSSESQEDGIYCSETLDSDSRENIEASSSKKSRVHRGGKAEAKDGNFLSPLACLAELAHADEKGSVRSKSGRAGGSSLRATKNVRRSSQNRPESNGGASTSSSNNNGLWFALKSATAQGEDGGFPQIKAPYLRIKDGKLPVSFVKTYLVKKLELKNESEVEITCRGQPVVPSLPLESVRKIWITTDSVQQEKAAEQLAREELLMVLTYGRNRRSLECLESVSDSPSCEAKELTIASTR